MKLFGQSVIKVKKNLKNNCIHSEAAEELQKILLIKMEQQRHEVSKSDVQFSNRRTRSLR